MLTAARRQYDRQARISALALRGARKAASVNAAAVSRQVGIYQAASIALALESLPDVLAEQGISDAASAAVATASLLTDRPSLAAMVENAATSAAFDSLVLAFVQDASRTATTVGAAVRPAVTGYVRSLQPPSCGRCAVLAGRVYPHSTGFQRHPRCDCLMTPTDAATGRHLVTDATALAKAGQIRGLSKGDLEAVNAGADLGQVVNVRRTGAGLTNGSSVITRNGRLTPQGVMAVASDRAEALTLLRRYGYIT